MIVFGDFQDRFAIASQTKNGVRAGSKAEMDETEIKRSAHQSVIANIGLVWLTIGFVLRLVTVVVFPSGNIITSDYFAQFDTGVSWI